MRTSSSCDGLRGKQTVAGAMTVWKAKYQHIRPTQLPISFQMRQSMPEPGLN